MNIRKDLYVFYSFFLISVFASLRSENFNDYNAYYNWYLNSQNINDFFNNLSNLPVPTDILFFFILAFFNTINFWHGFLFFIFFLSSFIKYKALDKHFDVFYISIFFLIYFGIIGFQFDLVQFRFGLALACFFSFIISKKPYLLILSLLFHFGVVIYLPAFLLSSFIYRLISIKTLKLLFFLMYIVHLFVFCGYLHFISFLNLEYLQMSDYLFGKVNNQFLFAKSEYSLFTLLRNSLVIFFVITSNFDLIKKNKFQFVLLLIIYFEYILFLPIDNFNARLMPLFELLFLFIFLQKIQQLFTSIGNKIFILFFSVLFGLFTFYYFYNSAEMYIK